MGLKDNIRVKLIKWLGISDLIGHLSKEIRELEEKVRSNNHSISNLTHITSNNKASINTLHRTVENVVSIGTDIDPSSMNNSSWSVICIEGKMNIVKFVDLSGRDAREVMNFLKQFEVGKHCIDSPSRMFREEVFKF